ncbi:Uncharacterized membrane protein [Halopenitus malekzadehii]|uniref:Uncharacterized membrane protein n=1 Tax=Halopenitus malekzadehii TaxID=1267564 RepID=A0A1H6IFE2_9EURY|nr:DUF1616 domain-containing protein [Halopenitus malekzadehii]SEH45629.1 Uncharacterized membrane protein [Halopenitus malekzadehii]
MARRDNGTGILPDSVEDIPPDLAAVCMYLCVTIAAIFLPGIRDTPIRVVLGLPFVLFIPGYAFIAALFPESNTSATDAAADADPSPNEAQSSDRDVESVTTAIKAESGGIDGIERVALSFGTSIAIVPLIGLVLNFTPWGIRLIPIVVSLTGVTFLLTFIAYHRRAALPDAYRFRVPYRSWIQAARREFLEPDDRADMVLNVLLVCSVLLAVSSVGYAVAVPQTGESFSELYLLTETDDGELVADNYPQNFTANQERSLTVGIGNQEHTTESYTVIVLLQRVNISNNSTTVLDQQQLQRFHADLEHNETWHHQHTIAPPMTGEDLRLTYLLYKDDPPSQPSTDNAYREVHLWITVSEPS